MSGLLRTAAVPLLLGVVALIWLVIELWGGPTIYDGGDELGRLSHWPDHYRAAWTRPVPVEPLVRPVDGDIRLSDLDSELRVNRAADDLDPSLTPGGESLLLASNRLGGPGGFDLYIAPREGSGFGEPVLLGPPLSTLFQERSPSLALLPDGSAELLFTSNRLHGSATDFDLYLARRTPDGGWGPPEFLHELSSMADERCATLHPEGDSIVFTRPEARGIEVYESHRRADGSWSVPEPLRGLRHPDNGPEIRFDEGGSALLLARGDDTVRSRLRILRAIPDGGVPWGAWILLALAALLLLLRLLASRWKGLEILYRCLLISVLVHLLLWWWLEDRGIEPPTPSDLGPPAEELGPIEFDAELFTRANAPDASQRAHGESVEVSPVAIEAAVAAPPRRTRTALALSDPEQAVDTPAERPLEPATASPPSVEELAAAAPARPLHPIDDAEFALREDPGRVTNPDERPVEVARAAPTDVDARDLPLPTSGGGRRTLPIPGPAAAEFASAQVPVEEAPRLIREPGPRSETISAPSRAVTATDVSVASPTAAPAPSEPIPEERSGRLARRAAAEPAPLRPAAVRSRASRPIDDGADLPAPSLARVGGATVELPDTTAERPAGVESERALPTPRRAVARTTRDEGAPAAMAAAVLSEEPDRAATEIEPRSLEPLASALPTERRTAVMPAIPRREERPESARVSPPPSVPAPRPDLPRIAVSGGPPAPVSIADAASRDETWVPWVSARRGPEREEALRRGGGDERTEAAVRRGLAYLAAKQRPGGGWGDPGASHEKYGETSVGRSALALLAFLGAGHAPGTDTEHSAVTERAIEYLRDTQRRRTGHFGGETSSYSHAIATYALGEAALMGAGDEVGDALRRGVEWILRNQDLDPSDEDRHGGWSYYYHDGHRYDEYPRVSVTVWQMMALETAVLAGVEVPAERIEAGKQWVLGQWSDRLDRYLYNLDPRRLRSSTPTLPASTPAAAFILQVLGHDRDDRRLEGALAMTAARPPSGWRPAGTEGFIERGRGNAYFWYYGTLALFLRGDARWEGWNEALKRTLLPSQDRDGSWEPISIYAQYAGDTDDERIYTTALNVLTLEVYYRYLTPFQEQLIRDRDELDAGAPPPERPGPERRERSGRRF